MNKYCKNASLTSILRKAMLALLLLSNHAFADPLADLIKGVAASLDKGRQNSQQTSNGNSSGTSGPVSATPHNQGNPQTTNSGNLITSASQYCEAIENNKLIREFSILLAKSLVVPRNNTEGNNVDGFRTRALDNGSGDLTKWVFDQLKADWKTCSSFEGKCFNKDAADKVVVWAGACQAKHVDDELFLFFTENFSSNPLSDNRERIRNSINTSSTLPNFIVKTGSKLWGTLVAVSLPNGINALEATGKRNVDEFRAYLDANIKEHEKSDREAAEFVRQEKEKRKAEQEFANSPNGKLTKAYQSMTAINQCVEIREGYAMVYINDVQHTKAKKLMRRIETALKNKLQGTTADELWKKTASSVNIRESFINAKLWLGANEIQVCQSFIQQLEAIGENVLGKNAPEKSW